MNKPHKVATAYNHLLSTSPARRKRVGSGPFAPRAEANPKGLKRPSRKGKGEKPPTLNRSSKSFVDPIRKAHIVADLDRMRAERIFITGWYRKWVYGWLEQSCEAAALLKRDRRQWKTLLASPHWPGKPPSKTADILGSVLRFVFGDAKRASEYRAAVEPYLAKGLSPKRAIAEIRKAGGFRKAIDLHNGRPTATAASEIEAEESDNGQAVTPAAPKKGRAPQGTTKATPAAPSGSSVTPTSVTLSKPTATANGNLIIKVDPTVRIPRPKKRTYVSCGGFLVNLNGQLTLTIDVLTKVGRV